MTSCDHDFDTPIDRQFTDSIKWAKYQGRDIIPLWVADMDFPSPPAVKEAIRQRAQHPVYGYCQPSAKLKPLCCEWLANKYDWQVTEEALIFTPGLVPAINIGCEAFTRPDEKVILQTPVYPKITAAPQRFGRDAITLPVKRIRGRWQMDFAALDEQLDQKAKLLILCSPHNPTGTVFTRQELTTLAQRVEGHDLIVISDEIHSDLILEPNVSHTPFATISEAMKQRIVTLTGPGKAFNLAGLSCGVAVIENPVLRQQFQAAQQGVMSGVNIFGFAAVEAAYQHGQPWLTALLDYLRGNRDYLMQQCRELPGVVMHAPEATYLAWIDISALGLTDAVQYFESYGIGVSGGEPFGNPGFIRLNFGCSRSLLETAAARLTEAVHAAYAAARG
ncbi:MalY/PatB family protein [Vibrio quintilis]|uniref:cysteine-S-conjugate beta-lyase n=1 Tax=Vibrio quintilis TaxID=1117707 RepID=A0A1M7YXX6_9VIBR|nr:PatB family C-S lyase [Vibrio quintilis]SHO57537.1 Cystathionine beta-lyase PatB [Vibrio quintilis]